MAKLSLSEFTTSKKLQLNHIKLHHIINIKRTQNEQLEKKKKATTPNDYLKELRNSK
jgi:hypothetical protein